MKFIKKNIRTIILIIVTAIIFTGFSVYATAAYFAKDISYTKNDGVKVSIEQALNELYDDFSGSHIEEGQITRIFPTSWKYETIVFENEYTEIPKIYYEYDAGTSGGSVFVTEITTESFKIVYNNFYTSNREDTIKWIAIGK